MDIVLSRILRFLNGALVMDTNYRIGTLIVKHYNKMKRYSLEDICIEGGFTKEEVLNFVKLLGFSTYEDFVDQLTADIELRNNEIQLRMIGLNLVDYFKDLNIKENEANFLAEIDDIVDDIYHANRIVIIGSHFPSCLAVDFQTDLINLGKNVIEYHHYDAFEFYEDDLVFFLTQTGRTMRRIDQQLVDACIHRVKLVIITQNPKIVSYKDVKAKHVLQVLGKYDGIQFNYQLMRIFDLLRIRYYYKYYIDDDSIHYKGPASLKSEG